MRRHDKEDVDAVVIDNEPEENISEDRDNIKGKPPQVEDDFTTH